VLPWQHLMVLYCWQLLVSQQQYKGETFFARQWQRWLCARVTVLNFTRTLLIFFTYRFENSIPCATRRT
jgi:hypothetical protein